tara:strand:+ start:314 stop:1036 length:723 start_codon:yes stop_codon:yes gene_type:complete
MENLNSDEKTQILLNLTGNEIFKVGQTSKTMHKICVDPRYNRLWQQKILEEFQTVYSGPAFQKYVELRTITSQTFYVVQYLNIDSIVSSDTDIFISREQAVDFIADVLAPDFNYFVVKTHFKKNNEIQNECGDFFTIIEQKVKKGRDIRKEKEEYVETLDKIKTFFSRITDGESEENILESVEEILLRIYDFMRREDLFDISNLCGGQIEEIDGIIEDLCEELVIEDNFSEVKTFIYSIL